MNRITIIAVAALAAVLTAAAPAVAQRGLMDITMPVRVGQTNCLVTIPTAEKFFQSNHVVRTTGTTVWTNLPAMPTLPGYVLVGNATSNAAAVALSGVVTITTNGVVAITNHAVTSAMLPVTLPTYILVGDANSNATPVALSGAATISTAGVLATVGLTTNVLVLTGTASNTFVFVAGRLTAIQ